VEMTQVVVSQPQTKDTRARVALALLCGLAVACTVMCITADADVTADEFLLSESLSELEQEQKVVSVDVDKVGIIYSAVPKGYHGVTKGGNSGRVRLLNYFKEIESRIATEVAGRKMDITKIKAKMAKNRAYNANARSKMKKVLLNKMAVNAKKAKHELDVQMEKTARTFHKQARLANKRWRKQIKTARKTRSIMRKNKREAAKQLASAVSNQQAALAALDQQMNAHIKKTNKHIAANAAAIKLNAKKARDALDHANAAFDKKLFNARAEAKKGRSALAAEAQSMDKKTRALISNSVKAEAAKTAAEFAKTRETMANDRAHADQSLKHSSEKFAAAMAAHKALQNKRFADTIADIEKAKEEAAALVAKATENFKVNLLQLDSTVKHQVTELNGKVTQLQGVITKNRLDQANVQRHVNAEMKRMVELGQQHENTLAKKDKGLRELMKTNHDLNAAHMKKMAAKFNMAIAGIKTQMKKDRAHQERNMHKQTSALYSTLAANEKAQGKVNSKLKAATRRARLDAEDNLRDAKKEFGKRLAQLHATVVANDKKADKKIKKLTGIVDRNAVKDAAGRRALKTLQTANKKELETAVRNAVHQGEMRALQVEKHAKDMNSKTRDAMNMRITNEIGTLTKKIHGSIEDLKLSTKEARKEMKREILYSVRSAAADAKKNLADMVKWSNKQFNTLEKGFEKRAKSDKAARAGLKKKMDEEKEAAKRALIDAVANQNKALLALKTVTQKKLKKTNTAVNAYGERVAKHAKEVTKQMAANLNVLEGKIKSARSSIKAKLTAANKASIARKEGALEFISSSLKQAEIDADKKFGAAYIKMGKARSHFDSKVASAAIDIQKVIAKRSALYDSRFAKTVKDVKLAQDAAYLEVVAARKAFTSGIVGINSAIKDQETRLTGDIELISTEVQSRKVQQKNINRKVDLELKRILKLSNTQNTEARKARGAIRKIFEEHKAVAAKEREALAKSTQGSLTKLRSKMAADRRQAAEDLTKASKALYGAVSTFEEKQQEVHTGLQATLGAAKMGVAEKRNRAKKDFEAKLMTLTNVVSANNVKYEVGINRLTGVAHSWKIATGEDRKLLRDQIGAMEKDLNKAIVKAIQIGEAKAKGVQERALEHTSTVKKVLTGEIAEKVEVMADDVFRAVLENRGKIADNYLAFKGYCGANAGDIIDYVQKNNGRGLFSLGDLLTTVAAMSVVHTTAAEGMGMGGDKVMPIFGGDNLKVSSKLSKTNGLVDEWSEAMQMVRTRWPYGIGHYLLSKVQYAMQNEGMLTVGSVADKDGQYVYVNGHAIGLSNKLDTLTSLAASAKDYQGMLKKLTTDLPKKKKVAKKEYFVPGKEWQGN